MRLHRQRAGQPCWWLWTQADLGSDHSSAAYQLCDLRRVTSPSLGLNCLFIKRSENIHFAEF